MVNKEKLLLVATIYALLPGAAPEAIAEAEQRERTKNKRSAPLQKVQPGAAAKLQSSANSDQK